MTVASTPTVAGPFTGTGASATLPFAFKCFAASDLIVQSGGITLNYGGDYTATLNADQEGSPGGTVTVSAAANALGVLVYVGLNMALSQPSSFPSQSKWSPTVVEKAFDRVTLLIKQLTALGYSAVVAPLGESLGILPSKTIRTGKYFAFDANGDPSVASGTGNDSALRTDIAASAGSSLSGFIQSATGAVARSVQSRLRDLLSVKDFGAVGNGSTDDTAAITSANTATGRKFTPSGTYLTTLAATALDGPFYGEGQIKDSAGNKRGPWLTAVKLAPASGGNFVDISTSFNGDLSKVLQAIEHRVSGASTLGTPATGYLFTPEAAAKIVVSLNTSGWNQSLSTDDGRTSATVCYVKLQNNGQGDHAYLSINGFVSGAKASATDFLANPAITMVNGTFTAGANAVYLNPHEVDLELGTFDAAAIGYVSNVTRTTGDTGPGLGSVVGGFRSNSKGTYAADWAFSASGLYKAILDATMATLTAAKCVIVIAGGQRFYFNGSTTDGRKATSYGTDWVERSTSGIDFYFNNTLAWRIADTGLQANLAGLRNFANDAAAAAATPAVPLGGFYRNGSVLMVRAA